VLHVLYLISRAVAPLCLRVPRYDTRAPAVAEAFDALADFVDRSDPDILLPNREHGLQTGECGGQRRP
jgi:hypothetical protein